MSLEIITKKHADGLVRLDLAKGFIETMFYATASGIGIGMSDGRHLNKTFAICMAVAGGVVSILKARDTYTRMRNYMNNPQEHILEEYDKKLEF